MRPRKTTKKPGLTPAMMKKRYEFCLKYEHWTIEDWKKVIWTDETSVCLGIRRGKIRVWRTPDEQYDPTVMRRRFAGYSEFMFWASFSWYHKGPCHIWEPETNQENKAAQKEIDRLNALREATAKETWELNTAMSRIGLRNLRGRKPTWKWNETNGLMVRNPKSKGGIDWWRYGQHILLPKLLPFALRCKKSIPDTIVQEDNAPSHASKHQENLFMNLDILHLLWPGNSPDLNMIEPCWPWMKRQTTRRGAPPT